MSKALTHQESLNKLNDLLIGYKDSLITLGDIFEYIKQDDNILQACEDHNSKLVKEYLDLAVKNNCPVLANYFLEYTFGYDIVQAILDNQKANMAVLKELFGALDRTCAKRMIENLISKDNIQLIKDGIKHFKSDTLSDLIFFNCDQYIVDNLKNLSYNLVLILLCQELKPQAVLKLLKSGIEGNHLNLIKSIVSGGDQDVILQLIQDHNNNEIFEALYKKLYLDSPSELTGWAAANVLINPIKFALEQSMVLNSIAENAGEVDSSEDNDLIIANDQKQIEPIGETTDLPE